MTHILQKSKGGTRELINISKFTYLSIALSQPMLVCVSKEDILLRKIKECSFCLSVLLTSLNVSFEMQHSFVLLCWDTLFLPMMVEKKRNKTKVTSSYFEKEIETHQLKSFM